MELRGPNTLGYRGVLLKSQTARKRIYFINIHTQINNVKLKFNSLVFGGKMRIEYLYLEEHGKQQHLFVISLQYYAGTKTVKYLYFYVSVWVISLDIVSCKGRMYVSITCARVLSISFPRKCWCHSFSFFNLFSGHRFSVFPKFPNECWTNWLIPFRVFHWHYKSAIIYLDCFYSIIKLIVITIINWKLLRRFRMIDNICT